MILNGNCKLDIKKTVRTTDYTFSLYSFPGYSMPLKYPSYKQK